MVEDEDIVEYCTSCLSLAIIQEEDDEFPYCNECKGCNIDSCTIEQWEEKHKKMYPEKWVLHPRNIVSRETIKQEYNKLKRKLNGNREN